MFLRLLALFTLVPLFELYLLIKIGTVVGVGPTILLVIGTGTLGAYLAKEQGARAVRRVQNEINAGRMPADALIDGLLILIAGGLLLTPGILTDCLGFFLLVPAGRQAIRRAVAKRIRRAIEQGTIRAQAATFTMGTWGDFPPGAPPRQSRPGDIDVEGWREES